MDEGWLPACGVVVLVVPGHVPTIDLLSFLGASRASWDLLWPPGDCLGPPGDRMGPPGDLLGPTGDLLGPPGAFWGGSEAKHGKSAWEDLLAPGVKTSDFVGSPGRPWKLVQKGS